MMPSWLAVAGKGRRHIAHSDLCQSACNTNTAGGDFSHILKLAKHPDPADVGKIFEFL